jgi:hypothetical protein
LPDRARGVNDKPFCHKRFHEAAHKPVKEFLNPVARFQIPHWQGFRDTFLGGEPGPRFGFPANGVNQAQGKRLAPGKDPAIGQGAHARFIHAPAIGHDRDELAVQIFQNAHHLGPPLIG